MKEKYEIDDARAEDPFTLKLIYACEWFDIPPTSTQDLIEFHPFLTNGDYDQLMYCKMQHYIELGLSFGLCFLMTNRVFFRSSMLVFNKRLTRWPMTALLTSGTIGAFNYKVLSPMLETDYEFCGLNKYYNLDLNIDQIKEDLSQQGIHVKANYFNLEAE